VEYRSVKDQFTITPQNNLLVKEGFLDAADVKSSKYSVPLDSEEKKLPDNPV
jgi:hypothetical protein